MDLALKSFLAAEFYGFEDCFSAAKHVALTDVTYSFGASVKCGAARSRVPGRRCYKDLTELCTYPQERLIIVQ